MRYSQKQKKHTYVGWGMYQYDGYMVGYIQCISVNIDENKAVG